MEIGPSLAAGRFEIDARGLAVSPGFVDIHSHGDGSLRFGRVAASLIVLCRLGRMAEPDARAVIVAGEGRRAQVEKLWDRFAASYLKGS